MENKMWTTKMLLDLLLRTEIKESRYKYIDIDLFIDYDTIVALLKAFDLYEESGKGMEIDISIFSKGFFILKRDKKEVAEILRELENLLQELCDLSDEKPVLVKHRYYNPNNPNKDHWLLMDIFHELFEYRKALNYFTHYSREYSLMLNYPNRVNETLSLGLLWQISIKELVRQMQRIDDILLKITGEKEPVSESELIEKYGFPKLLDTDLLDGSKSLKELLAGL
jgi:hypothetical protein